MLAAVRVNWRPVYWSTGIIIIASILLVAITLNMTSKIDALGKCKLGLVIIWIRLKRLNVHKQDMGSLPRTRSYVARKRSYFPRTYLFGCSCGEMVYKGQHKTYCQYWTLVPHQYYAIQFETAKQDITVRVNKQMDQQRRLRMPQNLVSCIKANPNRYFLHQIWKETSQKWLNLGASALVSLHQSVPPLPQVRLVALNVQVDIATLVPILTKCWTSSMKVALQDCCS